MKIFNKFVFVRVSVIIVLYCIICLLPPNALYYNSVKICYKSKKKAWLTSNVYRYRAGRSADHVLNILSGYIKLMELPSRRRGVCPVTECIQEKAGQVLGLPGSTDISRLALG